MAMTAAAMPKRMIIELIRRASMTPVARLVRSRMECGITVTVRQLQIADFALV
jgi:hypothetical protein